MVKHLQKLRLETHVISCKLKCIMLKCMLKTWVAKISECDSGKFQRRTFETLVRSQDSTTEFVRGKHHVGRTAMELVIFSYWTLEWASKESALLEAKVFSSLQGLGSLYPLWSLKNCLYYLIYDLRKFLFLEVWNWMLFLVNYSLTAGEYELKAAGTGCSWAIMRVWKYSCTNF